MKFVLSILIALVCAAFAATAHAAPSRYLSLISIEIGLAVLAPAPGPAPSPVSAECDNCKGTGKLGDGRISVTCPVCEGTGKRATATQFVSTLPRPAAIALRDTEYANEGRRFQFQPLRKAAGVRAFGGRMCGPGGCR